MPTKSTPVHIENLTRGTTVVSAGRVADRFWPRLIGLMLARPLPPGAGLVIVPCSSIHTQFMGFSIDVLYVNKQDVIVGIDSNLLLCLSAPHALYLAVRPLPASHTLH